MNIPRPICAICQNEVRDMEMHSTYHQTIVVTVACCGHTETTEINMHDIARGFMIGKGTAFAGQRRAIGSVSRAVVLS